MTPQAWFAAPMLLAGTLLTGGLAWGQEMPAKPAPPPEMGVQPQTGGREGVTRPTHEMDPHGRPGPGGSAPS
jgi:hypothetical protein